MKSAGVVALSVSLVLLAAVGARAELLVNGGFEAQPNFGGGVSGDGGYSALTGAQIPGWTIEAGHAATVHNTAFYPYISGSYSINMDGEGYNGVNANFYQDVATAAGVTYTLEFDWQGWQATSARNLNVSIKDVLTNAPIVSGNYAYSPTLHHEIFTFAGTGANVRLRVEELPQSGFNDNGFMVDNFSLVPSPAGLALFGLGGVLVGRRRR